MNIFKMIWPEFHVARGVEIGLAELDDARAIGVLSRELVEAGLWGWSWNPDRVARQIRDPDTLVLVARTDGRLVAFAIMGFGERSANLELLGVTPEYRRSGIGRCLVTFLEKSAYALGVSAINLEVRANNEIARIFYKTLGFRDTETIPNYYNSHETAVRMARRLRTRPMSDTIVDRSV